MSFTNEEFVAYIQGLEFIELEDVAEFVQSYWKEYNDKPTDENSFRYNACIATFGHLFLYFTREAIKMRKDYESREALEQQS
jgi:hypothetical protein